REERVLGFELHAAGERFPGLSILADAHVPRSDARDCSMRIEQQLSGGKPWVHIDTQALGLLRQPTAHISERDHVGTMIVHERRHERIRKAKRAFLPE